MKLSNHQIDVLAEVQDHVHKAYSLLVTEFNINKIDQLSKQVGVDVELVMMNVDKMLKNLLVTNNINDIEDNKNLEQLYVTSTLLTRMESVKSKAS